MTHQEAVSALRAYADGYAGNIRGMCAEAADMLEELDKRVPRWISVEERLPEEDVDVLVFAINDLHAVIAITSYSHHLYGLRIADWRSPWEYFTHNYTITHWMPLPEPPEEGEK